MILYRQTPLAIVSHIIASCLVVVALWPVVPQTMLLYWLAAAVAIGVVRLILCLLFLARWPISDADLPPWTTSLRVLAFLHAATWGASVFVIWPEPTEYRAFLVAVLAGVIAAGGILLAAHRRSFFIYCLPIAIPAFYQLIVSGGRVELILSSLILLYSLLLVIAVTRLGQRFLDGITVRLQMESLSRTDPLTHIANRRGFDEYLEDVWHNAIRSMQPIGLILADVDYFKPYNDRYGHPRGDEALAQLAGVLTSAASRGTDLCARVGGEEFAIVLPSTDADGTYKIAEHLQDLLTRAAIPFDGSPVGHLTVSIGYSAIVPTRSDTVENFIEAVDQALYEAKRQGRNRIESAANVTALSAAGDQISIDAP